MADPLPEHVVVAFEQTGLLPSRSHELVRNILVSPPSGFAGGRADLRGVAAELDRLLLSDPALAVLPGRFLFVLDDGRGDLIGRSCDLGLVATSADHGQLRIGDDWAAVVPLDVAAAALVDLARTFLSLRGSGADAAWHVRELRAPLASVIAPHEGLPGPTGPLPYGQVAGGHHHEVPDGVLTRVSAASLLDEPILIVTPWRGVFVPDSTEQ
ncbi:MAG: nitrite reductase [Marmoricola sp.]